MPLVSVRLIAGRSHEELASLAQGLSDVVSETLGIPLERVRVHIFELEPDRIARGGKLVSDSPPPAS